MGDASDAKLVDKNNRDGTQPMQMQGSFPAQPNAMPMQAAMGPQGGTSQNAMAAGQQNPSGMSSGPQEWEWLTMSL